MICVVESHTHTPPQPPLLIGESFNTEFYHLGMIQVVLTNFMAGFTAVDQSMALSCFIVGGYDSVFCSFLSSVLLCLSHLLTFFTSFSFLLICLLIRVCCSLFTHQISAHLTKSAHVTKPSLFLLNTEVKNEGAGSRVMCYSSDQASVGFLSCFCWMNPVCDTGSE